MTADLRHGRWQDVLEGVECDTLIGDPPFGKRTHVGHDHANTPAKGQFERPIGFAHWTEDHVFEFVRSWSPRTRGWIVQHTSHDLIPAWEQALAEQGRYAFAPLVYLDEGKAPRTVGDGPASWWNPIMVARPRTGGWLKDWRRKRKALDLSCSLPGSYRRSKGDVVHTSAQGKRVGGKPLGVTRAIVRDYSFAGDLVCDPTAGHGTTLLAALYEGRRALGSEVDSEAHAAACARLAQGHTLDMFRGLGQASAPPEQQGLFPMVGQPS